MPENDEGVVEEKEAVGEEHAHGEDDASQPESEEREEAVAGAENQPDFAKEAREQAERAEGEEAQTPGPELTKEGPTGIVDADGNPPEGGEDADPAAEAPETVPEGQVLVQVIQGEHGLGVKCAQGIDYHSAKGILESAKSVLEADYLQKILRTMLNPRIATPGGPGFRQPPKQRGPKH